MYEQQGIPVSQRILFHYESFQSRTFFQSRTQSRTSRGHLQITTGLPDIIVGAIKGRSAATLNSKDTLLAAVLLPKFKLHWVREESKRDHIELLLTMECSLTEEPAAPMPDPTPTAATSGEDFFVSFDIQPDTTTDFKVPMSMEKEVMDYLKSAPTMENKLHSAIPPQNHLESCAYLKTKR